KGGAGWGGGGRARVVCGGGLLEWGGGMLRPDVGGPAITGGDGAQVGSRIASRGLKRLQATGVAERVEASRLLIALEPAAESGDSMRGLGRAGGRTLPCMADGKGERRPLRRRRVDAAAIARQQHLDP